MYLRSWLNIDSQSTRTKTANNSVKKKKITEVEIQGCKVRKSH